ncbi:MAG: orotate phosphoribosyltransferase [Candidatus Magasanikbacteria bacterium]|nr:orotate phosphoribosyltransferase [Candidatus Magasanikbacteria bacterium]
MSRKDLILKLYEVGGIKFGEFKLKTGSISPIYIDLRVTISYPELLQEIADIMWEKVHGLDFNILCGVPYTALPIATAMSLKNKIPMVMRRKEVKDHGTKKSIEGVYKPGQKCLIVEDLVTSGSSVFETIEPLVQLDLQVSDVVVLLDREQGGRRTLSSQGYNLHSIFTMTELMDTLLDFGKIDKFKYEEINKYLNANQIKNPPMKNDNPHKTYTRRADLCTNPIAKKLLNLMDKKQSNLAIAADVTTKAELIKIADEIGPEICVLKTHIDIIEDFDQSLIEQLQFLANKHNFIFFEDRKFADIGNTVKYQYEKGIYKIADWAHIVNAHTVAGPGIIMGLKEVGLPRERALLLLAEMSSAGNLAYGSYTEKTLMMAAENKDFVIGFIAMGKLTDDPGFINFTPGVKLDKGGDTLGQQYNTPEKVIFEQGSDIIIVGRGIYQAENPTEEAKKYREAGWQAYKKRIS